MGSCTQVPVETALTKSPTLSCSIKLHWLRGLPPYLLHSWSTFRTSKHSPLEMSWFARSMPNSVSLTGRVRLGVVEDETRRVCSSCGNPWRPSNGPGWYIVAHHSTTSQHLPLPSLQTWISRQLALESFSRPATRTLQELFTLQYPYYLAFLSTTGGISILPNTAQDHPITSCSPAHYTRCSL